MKSKLLSISALETVHERKPFLQPLPDSNAETVVQYLKRRGIDGKILKYCINQGILYQTTRSGYVKCNELKIVIVEKNQENVLL